MVMGRRPQALLCKDAGPASMAAGGEGGRGGGAARSALGGGEREGGGAARPAMARLRRGLPQHHSTMVQKRQLR